eukprot:NODE_407_length_9242_cov_0.441868.p6 type:complete len:142 gc:universal NODE_407_length_9242_cov_0.441868:6461-6886(+)
MIILVILTVYAWAEVTPCDGEAGSFTPFKIEFPDELPIGEESWFTVRGNFSKTITAGKITAHVYKGWLKMRTVVDDLCEKTDCPISDGEEINSYILVPKNSIAWTYKLIVDITDQDEERVGCFQVPMKFVRHKSQNVDESE